MEAPRKTARFTRFSACSASKRRWPSAVSIVLAALILLLPGMARADINSITPSPARVSVRPDSPTTVTITWRVARTETAGTLARVTSSLEAALMINGTRITGLAGTISQTGAFLTIAQTETLTFTETITIPVGYAQQIAKAAPGTVTIRRAFTDTLNVLASNIPVSAGGNTGALAVRRIELGFENDRRTDVIKRGETLRAVAEVSFQNSGTLQGEWRVVDPAASLGSQTGRVLQVVRQPLVSSGSGRTRIVSPPLPTKVSGLHMVSFSVQDTSAGLEIPILRYFVLEGTEEGADATPVIMQLSSPPAGAQVNRHTVFAWTPLAGSQAYRLEVFKPDGQVPVAGKLVPQKDVSLSLGALSFSHLESGKPYEWRVVAFGEGGRPLGRSERQPMIAP